MRSRVVERSPIHYGWVILFAGTFGAFMTTPGQTVGVSAFFDPITQQLELSREAVAFAYTFGTLLGLLPAPLIGRLVDRHGMARAGSRRLPRSPSRWRVLRCLSRNRPRRCCWVSPR